MPRLVLINTSFCPEGSKFAAQTTPLTPPLGLLVIAAPLSEAGFDVDLIDPQFDPDYMTHLSEAVDRRPVFVGMTTFMGPNIHNALKISAAVKARSPGTPIVWGGPLATSLPEMCFGDQSVDYIVMGIGEETALRLVHTLHAGRDPADLPHVTHRCNGGVRFGDIYHFEGSLDDLEFPRLDLWEAGIRAMGRIPILSSRGCPRNCAFCYNNTFTGRKRWYGRSAENVLAEMDQWVERFGLNLFHFVDDNFLVDTPGPAGSSTRPRIAATGSLRSSGT